MDEVKSKKCTKCLNEFDISNFPKHRRQCILCLKKIRSSYNKYYRIKNNEIIKVKRKKYYKENLTKIKESRKIYRKKNLFKFREREKINNRKRRELHKEYCRLYKIKNLEKIRERERMYNKESSLQIYDRYIKGLIRTNNNISANHIPSWLIETYREFIRLKREIKNAKSTNNERT